MSALRGKEIVFDADGVIFNTVDPTGAFLWQKNIFEDLPISAEALKEIFSTGWSDVIRGHTDTQKHVQAAFDKFGLSLAADDFIAYWLEKDTSLNVDVLAMIAGLDRERCHLGTNQDKLRAKVLSNRLGGYFRNIFSSSAIGHIKPEQEFFAHLEEHLDCAPQDIVFIDDSLGHCDAARKRGWQVHHYQNSADLKAFLAEK